MARTVALAVIALLLVGVVAIAGTPAVAVEPERPAPTAPIGPLEAPTASVIHRNENVAPVIAATTLLLAVLSVIAVRRGWVA